MEKDLEICVLKLNVHMNNFTIICIYRSTTGKFTQFLTHHLIILNDLYQAYSFYVVILT
jgi:hypothetical protein